MSKRSVITGALWNLSGQIVPFAAALVCIPRLVKGLGVERFGLLTLVWAFIGYFTLFDLGLGRALTQLVARRLGEAREAEIPHLCSLAQRIMLGVGLCGGVLLALCAALAVRNLLHVPRHLEDEAITAFILLAIGVPAVVATSGLVGILTAYQRFDLINYLRMPLGVYNFAAPLAVLYFSKSLVAVTAVLLAGRLINWGGHEIFCRRLLRTCPRLARRPSGLWRLLIGFGGWMTVTNIISPLMVYFDRFVIGSLVSIAAVAYYTTPYEVATKQWLISGAIIGALFPTFSAGAGDSVSNGRLLASSMKWVALVIFPFSFAMIVFAREGLALWLGSGFAANSSTVLMWLSLGVLVNCIAQVPFAYLQALGYPSITAKLHLLELPLYAVMLWATLPTWGVTAAAVAWTVRVTLDGVALTAISSLHSPGARGEIGRAAAFICVLFLPCLTLFVYVPPLTVRVALFVAVIVCYLGGMWKYCNQDAKNSFWARVRSLPAG